MTSIGTRQHDWLIGHEPDWRTRVRAVVDDRTPDPAPGRPETATIIARLGQAGLLRDRWALGDRGLRRGLALIDEVAQRSGGLSLAVLTHLEVFCGTLVRLAEGDQQVVLDGALEGRVTGCVAVTEDGAGSDLAALTTEATAEPAGWRLRGAKRYATNAPAATHALVLARQPDLTRRPGHELSLFLVDLRTSGVELTGRYPMAGLAGCEIGRLEIDAFVPRDALLGSPGLGTLYTAVALAAERLAIAAQLVAVAERALRLAAAYARHRAIGDGRLVDKQAVTHRLADVTAELAAVRSLLAATVATVEEGTVDQRGTAALKLASTRCASRATDEALQVLGGRGYSTNFPVESWWRDVRAGRIGGGTDDVMREIVGSGLRRPDPEFDRWVADLVAADHPDHAVASGSNGACP